jgi:hypothetical protein
MVYTDVPHEGMCDNSFISKENEMSELRAKRQFYITKSLADRAAKASKNAIMFGGYKYNQEYVRAIDLLSKYIKKTS